MLNNINRYVCSIFMGVALAALISAGAAADTIELENGDGLRGTILNETFTVVTPYSNIAVEKKKIREIKFNHENEDHDVITLDTGGLLEGNVDEPTISLKLDSGKESSVEKKDCKKIIIEGIKE